MTTSGQKPRADIFASDAKSGELSDFPNWLRGLGIAFDETNGFPEMSGINGLLQELHKNIRYLEELGISQWRSDIDYTTSSIVVRNRTIYKALAPNYNQDPELAQDKWIPLFVDATDSYAKDLGLSANQGRILAKEKLAKSDLVDNLNSIDDWTAVTAKQSKLLADGLRALKATEQQIELPNFGGGKTLIVKFGTANYTQGTTGVIPLPSPFPSKTIFAMFNDVVVDMSKDPTPPNVVMGWRVDTTTNKQLGFYASQAPYLFSYIAIGY